MPRRKPKPKAGVEASNPQGQQPSPQPAQQPAQAAAPAPQQFQDEPEGGGSGRGGAGLRGPPPDPSFANLPPAPQRGAPGGRERNQRGSHPPSIAAPAYSLPPHAATPAQPGKSVRAIPQALDAPKEHSPLSAGGQFVQCPQPVAERATPAPPQATPPQRPAPVYPVPQFAAPVSSPIPEAGSFVAGEKLVERFGSLGIQGPISEPPTAPVVFRTAQDAGSSSSQPPAGPPASSKSVTFPRRPGWGTKGDKCTVKANHFLAELPDKDLHHYDVTITPEVTSRGVNRAVIRQLVALHRAVALNGRLPAYDGRKSLYTAGPLPFTSKEFPIVLSDEDGSGHRRERSFKLVIKFASRADLHHLGEFLGGRQGDPPQEALQVLDIVLRERPTQLYTPVGRSFFSPAGATKLGGGLEGWRGFYQSIRPTQMGLSLNIDISSTAFLEPKVVIDFVRDFLNKDVSRSFSDADRLKIKKVLRGVKVEVMHRGSLMRKYRISGLTNQATDDLKFSVDEQGTLKSVTEYFLQTYGYKLRNPKLPCLQVGNPQRPNYLPMEVCKIVAGQRYAKRLTDKQIKALKESCQNPQDREKEIKSRVEQNAYHADCYAEEFGIQISNQLANVEARILPPPCLKYHDRGREKQCRPQVGQWNMRNKMMVNGGIVKDWACVNFSENVPQNLAEQFCWELGSMCVKSGMSFAEKPKIPLRSVSPDFLDSALKSLCEDVKRENNGKVLDLLVVILPENNGALYGDLKKLCETVLGIVSQCCLSKHVFKMNPQYLANVALKINVKAGGRNTVLVDAHFRRLPRVSDKPTIIFGADVTHPHPGEDSSPSIAAVVASQDWPEVTKYAGLVCAQAHRQELIQDLFKTWVDPKGNQCNGGMIKELLLSFYSATGQKPQRIIFYRDGVSEGQFNQVLLHELDAIRKACLSLEATYRPPVTFVVVQKRHHTRLFGNKQDGNLDKSGNVLPGTVVDTRICHPTEFDFYLCSHAGIQGTSRPAHYHVLWDENSFSADTLQSLTNDLCYTYARCTRAVSIVPPAYYAHLAAFRARFYSESGPSDSSGSTIMGIPSGATGSRSPGVGGAPVRPLPPLKDNVKKVMFYC